MSSHKNKHGRSNRIIVMPHTLKCLHKLADMAGYATLGRVVDKVVREKCDDLFCVEAE